MGVCSDCIKINIKYKSKYKIKYKVKYKIKYKSKYKIKYKIKDKYKCKDRYKYAEDGGCFWAYAATALKKNIKYKIKYKIKDKYKCKDRYKDAEDGGCFWAYAGASMAATALWATTELENWTQSVTEVGWTSFGLDSRQMQTNTFFECNHEQIQIQNANTNTKYKYRYKHEYQYQNKYKRDASSHKGWWKLPAGPNLVDWQMLWSIFRSITKRTGHFREEERYSEEDELTESVPSD